MKKFSITSLDKSVHVPGGVLEETLKTPSQKGKRLLEPLMTIAKDFGLPLNILEDNDTSNNAEVHVEEGDLWYCLQGEVEFICGGVLVDPQYLRSADGQENKNELFSKTIKDGKKVLLKEGDWLWIPPGEPHQHNCKGIARMVIVKVPRKNINP